MLVVMFRSCVNFGVKWWLGLGFVLGTNFQCVLGRLYVGTIISTKWVRYYYATIIVGEFFLMCIRKIICRYVIGPKVFSTVREAIYVGIVIGPTI